MLTVASWEDAYYLLKLCGDIPESFRDIDYMHAANFTIEPPDE